jgi:hypothetical protein
MPVCSMGRILGIMPRRCARRSPVEITNAKAHLQIDDKSSHRSTNNEAKVTKIRGKEFSL